MNERIDQESIITGPRLVTFSNYREMLAQESWAAGDFKRAVAKRFYMVTGRQVLGNIGVDVDTIFYSCRKTQSSNLRFHSFKQHSVH